MQVAATAHSAARARPRSIDRPAAESLILKLLVFFLPGAKGWRDEMKRGRDQRSGEPASAV